MDDRSFDRGLRHSSVHMISSLSKRFRTGSLLCLSVFQASYGQDDHEKEPLPLPWGKHQLKHREDWDTKRIVWDDPAVLSRGRGVCVIKSDDCLEHELFSGHFFDESESAYVDFDVGRSEAACLGRALTNWRLCGSLPWRDIEMTYIPSGASSSFPSTHEVREAKKVARGPLIGSGDGCSVRVFPNTSILNEDRKSSLVSNLWAGEELRGDSAMDMEESEKEQNRVDGGMVSWKLLFSYVHGHRVTDKDKGEVPSPHKFNGQSLADRWIMEIFRSKRKGFFIDLAANDAIRASNTVTLERLGWEGLCIEPQYMHVPGLMHRKCKVIHALVSNETGTEITVNKGGDCGHACAQVVSGDTSKNPARVLSTYRSVTFEKIIRDFRVPRVIDYISLDVETWETQVMSTFPWNTHTILSISIENPGEELIALLEAHGLQIVGVAKSVDTLFLNRRLMPSWHDVAEEKKFPRSEPRKDGLCTLNTKVCLRPGSRAGRSEPAYTDSEDGEAACLGSAEENWKLCGSLPWEPVEMVYVPTGASSNFPSADEAMEAERVDTAVLVGSGDGCSVGGLWADERLRGHSAGDSNESDLARNEEDGGMGAWKLLFSYVLGHQITQADKAVELEPDFFNGEMMIDRWVLQMFGSKRKGFFIDLAANDAIRASNTVTLERLGWEGLCIEPQYMHVPGLMHRKCKVIHAIVSDETGTDITFNNLGGCGHGCAQVVPGDSSKHPAGALSTYRSVTFEKIIRDFRVPRVIDYISLDVETWETQVMSTFPWNTHTILSMSIENPGKELIALLAAHGIFAIRREGHDLLFLNHIHPEYGVLMRAHSGSLD